MKGSSEFFLKLVIFVLLIFVTSTDFQGVDRDRYQQRLLNIGPAGARRKYRRCNNERVRICNKDQFTCFNGKCIKRNWYCDNGNDCGDNSDEQYCGSYSFDCPTDPPFIRCENSKKCIPEEWLCDGLNDCPSGDDELERNCGAKSELAARRRAIKWVWDRTFNDSTGIKWDAFVHKAAVALFLAEPFSNESHFQLDIAKDVSIQFLSRLSQKKLRDVPSSDVASFVNAMLVTCLNPRQFNGMNLVEELRTRVDRQNYTNPYILLTLCNAGETITEGDKRKLVETFRSKHREFWTDTQAMVVMALSCASKQPGNSVDEEIMMEFTDELKTHQYRNGSVENIQTTALVLQALYSTEQDEDPDNFDEEKAFSQIMGSQTLEGSFGNFMETYYVLPLLNCRSLVNVTADHCESTQTDETSALQDLANRVGPKIRVQYSLWFGDQKDMERTTALRVPANMSFYTVMEITAEIDERYRFEYLMKDRKPYINGLSGLLDDPETGKFWFMHILENGEPSLIPKSPADIIPKNNDHFVMWYRSGSWID